MQFKTEKTIGWSLLLGSVLVLIPYTILVMQFNYPDILRKPTGEILMQFHQGGNPLIYTWLAFALVGLPLLKASVLIGQKYQDSYSFVKWGTILGIVGFVVQIIGLLRWVFVVPVLANDYVTGNELTKAASVTAFKVIHQFGGVLLGEHLGQLFSIAWTIMVAALFLKLKLFPRSLHYFGITASVIYLSAQAELLNTVIPGFPYIGISGFLGSTLWLIYLMLLGGNFLLHKK
ncbi:MAG: DUF4386 domain-containing protein [Flavobacterium sp.]